MRGGLKRRGATKRILVWGVCVGTLGGCGAESLTNSGGYPQEMVGARRVALTEGTQHFSDYVFGADGALTHLRSVASGQVVDAKLGAGIVRGVDGVSCQFGGRWYGVDESLLVIDGICGDGVGRDIALNLTSLGNAQQVAEPGATWMMPSSWRIQRCDQKACAD